ncbi:unnamed protein product [Gongylonema pulchrum]|uniref:ShKT domain-containing protein n=1 Tax=Gongylonema pulchrum TaxID=637853 RepID=A0A183DXY5_9BILA|nr:unnamed protein product [Gongylonema pulchrum]
MAKCPSGDSFDAARGICANKCDLCGCAGGDDQATMPACYPGEVISRGTCLDTYLECTKQHTFEIRRCSEEKRFDSVLLMCKIYNQVAECFIEKGAGDGATAGVVPSPPWPQFHVDDSFQPPSAPPVGLQSIFVNPAEESGLNFSPHYDQTPHSEQLIALPFTTGHDASVLLGAIQGAPLGNVFVPQSAPVGPVMSAFGSATGPVEHIKDTFHAIPAPLGSVSFSVGGTNYLVMNN